MGCRRIGENEKKSVPERLRNWENGAGRVCYVWPRISGKNTL
jgi:hypothetical protein